MKRFDESMTQEDLDGFIAGLPMQRFTHADLMHCYSCLIRNDYEKSKAVKPLQPIKESPPARASSRGCKKWNQREIDALVEGIAKFGKGKWGLILSNNAEIFQENTRTAKDLGSKWKSIEKKPDIQKQLKDLQSSK